MACDERLVAYPLSSDGGMPWIYLKENGLEETGDGWAIRFSIPFF